MVKIVGVKNGGIVKKDAGARKGVIVKKVGEVKKDTVVKKEVIVKKETDLNGAKKGANVKKAPGVKKGANVKKVLGATKAVAVKPDAVVKKVPGVKKEAPVKPDANVKKVPVVKNEAGAKKDANGKKVLRVKKNVIVKRKNNNPKKSLKNAALKAKYDPVLAPKTFKAHFTAKVDFLHNLNRDASFGKMELIQKTLRPGLFKKKRVEAGIFVANDIDKNLETMTQKYNVEGLEKYSAEDATEQMTCLKRVYEILSLLDVFSKGTDDFYKENAAEVKQMAENQDPDGVVVLDMALSFVSRKELVLISLGKYMVKTFSAIIKTEQFEHLIEIIKKPGMTILDDEEEDDEFAPITDEDLDKIKAKKLKDLEDNDDEEEGDGAEDDSDDDSESSEDDDVDMDTAGATNQSMILALKEALGKAAVVGDDDDDVEMDDEELAKMDERLAVAFKEFTPQGRKARQQLAHRFRRDVAGLAAIVFGAVDLKTLLVLLPEFISLVVEAEEKNRTDLYQALYDVSIGFGFRKIDEDIGVHKAGFLKAIKDVLEASFKVHNFNLENALTNVSRYLLNVSIKNEMMKKNAVDECQTLFTKYFESKEKSGAFAILADVFSRHHEQVIELLPKLFEYFLGKSSKRNQAASLLNVCNRRDWRKQNPEVYEKTADLIVAHYEVEIDEESKKMEKAFKTLSAKTQGLFKKE